MKSPLDRELSDVSPHTVAEIYEELPLREVLRRVLRGMHEPPNSGEYKFARYHLKRLWSWFWAFAVPVMCLILLVCIKVRTATDRQLPDITIDEVVPIPPLDEKKPLPKDLVRPPDALTQNPIDNPSVDVTQPEPFSPQPAPVDSVLPNQSPKVMPNIIGRIPPGIVGTKDETIRQLPTGSSSETAVLRALRWLKKHQDPSGCWYGNSGGGGGGYDKAAAAMTGLAVLCYVAHGETPDSPEFGYTVEKALQWLVANVANDGRFQARDPHEYSLPIAAYALCEAYTFIKAPMLGEAATRAIETIVKGQNASGGWNYNCVAADRNDTSYMGWCAQALYSARLAGITLPGLDDALKRAVAGFRRNYHGGDYTGGFGYTGPNPNQQDMTGIGALSLQLLGAEKSSEVKNSLEHLKPLSIDWQKPQGVGARPLYHWYYITQARFREGGDLWTTWETSFLKHVPGAQVVEKGAGADGFDIGYWDSPSDTEKTHGRVVNTTLCCLMLEIYYKFLPTYRVDFKTQDLARNAMPDDGKIDVQVRL